jgi:hypothetical protein
MRFRNTMRTGLLATAAVCLAWLAPARAADVDKYLPNDTEIVVTINVRQIFDSALVKKYALEHLTAAIKASGETEKVLEALGLNPTTDVNSVALAGPGGDEPDKGLFIVRGKFDTAKFQAKAKEAAEQGKHLKIAKAGDYTVYEVPIDNPGPVKNMFVAVVDQETIVASPGQKYVTDALDKHAGKQQSTINKDIQGLIGKEDANQSVWMVVLSSALRKSSFANNDEKVKEILGKFQSFSGGFTVSDEVRLDLNIAAKNTDDAADLKKELSGGLEQAKGFAAVIAGSQPQLAPLTDVLDSIKVNADKNSVVLKGKVSKDLIEKALKK